MVYYKKNNEDSLMLQMYWTLTLPAYFSFMHG